MLMKLPNSYGSVYKLPGKRRCPYRCVVTEGWQRDKETGKYKQIRKTIGYYEKKDIALQKLAEYHENPYNLETSKITLQEVYERWSDEHFPTVSDSNIKGYKASYKLCEPIAHKRFVDVSLDDLQKIADNSGKNYPTLRKYKVLVGMLFKYAVIHDIIPPDRNKTEYLNIKQAGNPNALDRKPFTTKEIEKIWEWEGTNEYFSVILMLIYSGVRISELLELKKENVNLTEQWFDVTASKTKAGVRKVPIHNKVLPFFERWLSKNDCTHLISTPEGQSFSYSNYYDSYWKPLMQQVGQDHRPHDTRHTCISLLTMAGVDERMIKKIVGHKGQGVTQQVYTHFEIKALLEAINKIGERTDAI